MSKRIGLPVLASVCALGATVSARGQIRARSGLPSIIEREPVFGDPAIPGSPLPPAGQFFWVLKPSDGTRNLCVKRTTESFDAARPITAETRRPISQYFWSRDSKYLLFAQDQGGDENFNIYAVKPSDPPAAATGVPV